MTTDTQDFLSDPQAGETAVLDFNSFLVQQPASVQQGFKTIFDNSPDPEARKRQIGSIVSVASALRRSGNDDPYLLAKVNQNWPTLRAGYAEVQGGEDWQAAKNDDDAFNGLLVKQAQEQRNQRALIQGMDDNTAPGAVDAWQNSLVNRAREAAYNGGNYADALSDWIGENEGKLGYDETKAGDYADIAKSQFDTAKATVDKVRPIAERAFDLIAEARGVYDDAGEHDGGEAAPLELFRGLTPAEKQLAFRMMGDQAQNVGGKSTAREILDGLMLGSEKPAYALDAQAMGQLTTRKFTAGDKVLAGVKDPFTQLELEDDTNGLSDQHGFLDVSRFFPSATRELSGDEAAQWNQQAANRWEDLRTVDQLRRFGQRMVEAGDASNSGLFFNKVVFPTLENAPLLTAMMLPGMQSPSLAVMGIQAKADAVDRLENGGMASAEAERVGGVEGYFNAASMMLEAGALKGFGNKFLPNTSATLRNFALTGNPWARYAANAAGVVGAGTVTTILQNDVIPAVVQDALTNDPRFHEGWGDVWKKVVSEAGDDALGMVMIAAASGAIHTVDQSAIATETEQLAANPAAMMLRGYTEEQIKQIQAAATTGDKFGLLQKWANQAPPGTPEGRQAYVEKVVQQIQAQRAMFEAKADGEKASELDALDYATSIVRNGDGWTVNLGSGKSITVDTAEAARRIREDLQMTNTQAEADGLVGLIEHWHDNTPEGTQRETALTGETATGSEKGISFKRDGEVTRVITDPAALEEFRREANADGPMNVPINGSNDVYWSDKVANGAKQLVQRLELHQSDSAVLTFLHESAEADFRRALQLKVISEDDMRKAVSALAAHFDPDAPQVTDPTERVFRERLQRVAQGEGNFTDLRETLSELAVADAVGRRKDGSHMPAGSITAGLDAAMRNGTSTEDIKSIGRVRAAIRAIRQYFRAIFGTAAGLKKARREGAAEHFDALIDKATGRTAQANHERAAAQEAAKLAGLEPEGGRPGALPDHDPENIGAKAWIEQKMAEGMTREEAVAARTAELAKTADAAKALAEGSIVRKKDGMRYVKTADGWREIKADGRVVDNSIALDENLRGATVESPAPVPSSGLNFSVRSRKYLPGDYPETLSRTITSTNVGKLKSHPRYDEAKKQGNGEAADHVVADTLKPASVEALRKIIGGRDVTFVPVVQRDVGKRTNALPLAYAGELASRLGGSVEDRIVKASGSANTGASVEKRFSNEQRFDGPVEPGKLYVVVDDTHTSGDTLVSLIDHIKEGGGEILASTALANSQSGSYLKPRSEDVAKLLDATGLDAEGFKREFGLSVGSLTGSEIYRLANLGPRGWDTERFRQYVRSRLSEGGGAPNLGRGEEIQRGTEGGGGEKGGVGFRVTAGSSLDLIQKRIDEALDRDPDRRRAVGQKIADNLRKLGGDFEGISDLRGKAELDKEQSAKQLEFFKQKLEELGIDSAEATGAKGPKLQAQTKVYRDFMASQEFQRVYEAWEKQGMHPDDVAQLAGRMADAHRERFVKDVKHAWDFAHESAAEWRRSEDTTQAEDWSQRASTVRGLRMLDAITSAMHPEDRAKVGGMIKLAGLATEKARVAEILRRVDRMKPIVEKRLQKENTAALDRLIERATPKGGPGEKAGGKIGVEGHRVFDDVQAAASKTGAEVQARLHEIENEIADPKIDDNKARELWREDQALRAFGDWKNKSAADGDAALRWLKGVYDTGRNAWLEQKAQERFQVQDGRALAKKEAIRDRPYRDVQDAEADDTNAGEKGDWTDFLTTKNQDFPLTLSSTFGDYERSEVTKYWEQKYHDASHGKAVEIEKRQKALNDMLKRVLDTKSDMVAAAKMIFLQRRNKKSGVFRYVGRERETVKIPVDKAQEIIDGKADAATFGLKPEDVDSLRAALDEWAANPKDRHQSLSIDVVKNEGQRVEQQISQMEAIYFTMAARQAGQLERFEKHGWTTESMGQLESFLAPEAKAIRSWLTDYYEREYDTINRVYQRLHGIDMPRVDNYSPLYFDHDGKPVDLLESLTSPNLRRGIEDGFTRQRQNHSAELRQMDAIETWASHMMASQHFVHFAELSREARAVFDNPEVRNTIKAYEGIKKAKAISEHISNMERDGATDAVGHFIAPRLAQSLRGEAMSGNPQSIMKHLSNIPQTMADVSFPRFMVSALRFATGQGAASFTEMLHSEPIRLRMARLFDPITKQALAGNRAGRGVGGWIEKLPGGQKPADLLRVGNAAIGNVIDLGLSRLGWMGNMMTAISSAIAYDAHYREALDSGATEEDARQSAERETEMTIARTAMPESIDRKSLAEMQFKGFLSVALIGRTPERAQWAHEYTAVYNAITGKGSAGKAVRVLFLSHVIIPLITQSVHAAFATWINKNDDDAWSPKKFAAAMILGPLSGIVGFGTIVEAAAKAAFGIHGGQGENPISDLLSAPFRTWRKLATGQAVGREMGEFLAKLGAVVAAGHDYHTEVIPILWQKIDQLYRFTHSKEELDQEKKDEKQAIQKSKKPPYHPAAMNSPRGVTSLYHQGYLSREEAINILIEKWPERFT